MTALANIPDHMLLDYMNTIENQISHQCRKAIEGPDPDIKTVFVAEMGLMARAAGLMPEFDEPRLARVRALDAMLPDWLMGGRDVLEMCTAPGRQAIRFVLDRMPELAEACGYEPGGNYGNSFPFDRLVARGLEVVSPGLAERFVEAFHQEFSVTCEAFAREAAGGIIDLPAIRYFDFDALGLPPHFTPGLLRLVLSDELTKPQLFDIALPEALEHVRQTWAELEEQERQAGLEVTDSSPDHHAGAPRL